LKAVKVARSVVGRGVFAKRDFETDELVGVVEGTIVDESGYGSEYCIDLGESKGLEPAAPFRYLNHCCEPNSGLVIEEPEDGGPLRIVVMALSPIKAGQELLIDYAWPAECAIPCRCGSVNCRGWVVAEEDLPHVAALAMVD
jgi:hypothetical protein